LNFDINPRFSTSVYRLIRIIIRNFKCWDCSSRKTIERWTSVRAGEEINIFPYQQKSSLAEASVIPDGENQNSEAA
jgi:hypothetical protein